jgi:prepilin-type N-terminal cleavage/methylation domain-containing protein
MTYQIHPARKTRSNGFSLIEVLAALALLGVLGVIAGGFMVPLKLSQQSSQESQALAYGRTFIEILKSRWTNEATYKAMTVPSASTDNPVPAKPDIEVAAGWTISSNTSSWTADQTTRNVVVTINSPNGKPTVLTTQITR